MRAVSISFYNFFCIMNYEEHISRKYTTLSSKRQYAVCLRGHIGHFLPYGRQ